MPSPTNDNAPPPKPFGDRTPWTAGAAGVFGLITVAVAIACASSAQPLHGAVGRWIASDREETAVLANTMLTLLVMQAVILAMVWWATARFGGKRRVLLSLQTGLPLTTVLYGLAGMVALLVPYNLAIYLLWPGQFAADLRPFWELARSPAVWLAAIAVGIGAPLAEELLFRGFLLPALTKTKWGFPGGAVIATVGWTALHFYSLAGLVEVCLIGLYFSFLMWRFQNLWLPILLHALYNSLQLAVMALWPA